MKFLPHPEKNWKNQWLKFEDTSIHNDQNSAEAVDSRVQEIWQCGCVFLQLYQCWIVRLISPAFPSSKSDQWKFCSDSKNNHISSLCWRIPVTRHIESLVCTADFERSSLVLDTGHFGYGNPMGRLAIRMSQRITVVSAMAESVFAWKMPIESPFGTTECSFAPGFSEVSETFILH